MLYRLIDLPLGVGLVVFCSIIVLLGGLIFMGVHHLFVKPIYEKVHYRISRLLFRTSASLLALMLSFTYANQRIDFITIKNSIQAEASKLVDIHRNLKYFDTPEAKDVQHQIHSYIKIVLDEGWEPISKDPFNSRTVQAFGEIDAAILDLEPVTERQTMLKSKLLSDADEVSDYLQVRIYKTRPETPFLFYVACFGFVVVMILFSTYKPDKISISFISLYNAFIAIVLYFILMMNNPLVGPMQVKAESFEILKETIQKNLE